jgi:hypothetical protein
VRWTPIAVTVVGAVVVVGLLLFLVQNMAQGTTALSMVKEQTRAGLARETERAAAGGDSLEVTWSTTPMPGGGGETVLAHLEAQPSGASGQAQFMVMDGQVTSMDDLAQRLLSGAGAAGTAAPTMMDEDMQMPMP